MDVLNTSLHLAIRRGRSYFLIALCLLATLRAPVDFGGATPSVQEVAAGRQTMGFEYLRDAPVLFGHGITADLVGQPIDSVLNGAAGMRLNWIRQPVRWADIEPAEGVYSWELLDPVVTEVRVRGFHLLLAITGTPHWAHRGWTKGAEDGPPAELATLAGFLGILSARYAGVVDAYQIWQSPNVEVYWDGQPSPRAYSQILKAAHRAVKASDPGALIVSGDVVLEPSESEQRSVDGLLFLEEMIQFGAAGACDAIGVAIDSSITSPVELIEDAQQLTRGYAQVPIWVTRAGWSCPEADSGAIAACEEQQADYLVRLAAGIDKIDSVQALIVDNFNLATVDPNHPAASRSLIRSDWSPRPAFLEYARMRQEQAMAAEQVTVSIVHNRSAQSGPKPRHRAVEK